MVLNQTNKPRIGKAGDEIHKGITIRTGNAFATLGEHQHEDEVATRGTMVGDKNHTGKGC